MSVDKKEQIRSINQKVLKDIDSVKKEDIEKLASFTQHSGKETRTEALITLFRVSQREPVKLLPAIPALENIISNDSMDDDTQSRVYMIANKIQESPEIQELVSHVNDDKKTAKNPRAKSNSDKSSTVTENRLKGRERHFYDVTQFMKPDEKPLFIFALTKSMLAANGSVVVDKHGSDMTLVENNNTGSLLISDYGIRILTEAGRWGIAYQSITGVGTETSPTPTLKLVSAGEVYKIRVAKTIHEQSQVSEAVKLIQEITHSI